MKSPSVLLLSIAASLSCQAAVINFDDLGSSRVIGTTYVSQGVSFDAFVGQDWDMYGSIQAPSAAFYAVTGAYLGPEINFWVGPTGYSGGLAGYVNEVSFDLPAFNSHSPYFVAMPGSIIRSYNVLGQLLDTTTIGAVAPGGSRSGSTVTISAHGIHKMTFEGPDLVGGFSVDNLTFGAIIDPLAPAPEPDTIALGLVGLSILAAYKRKA